MLNLNIKWLAVIKLNLYEFYTKGFYCKYIKFTKTKANFTQAAAFDVVVFGPVVSGMLVTFGVVVSIVQRVKIQFCSFKTCKYSILYSEWPQCDIFEDN